MQLQLVFSLLLKRYQSLRTLAMLLLRSFDQNKIFCVVVAQVIPCAFLSLISNHIEVEKALAILMKGTLLESGVIFDWMLKYGNEYPDFKGLIHAVENLRWAAVDYCRSVGICDED